jgi:hypothetical protein
MAEQRRSRLSWVERRREQKRLKQERSGDSPQKHSERPQKKAGKDAADGGMGGFFGGGGGGG